MALRKETEDIKNTDDGVSSESSEAPVSWRKNKRRLIFAVLIVVAIVLLIGFMKAQREIANLRTPEGQEAVAREEVEKVVAQVQKHILVPEGETPTLATVVDAAALIAEQPFYIGAQDGDKVLLYLETQRAIIYSPERDIIVNVGPLILNNQANQ